LNTHFPSHDVLLVLLKSFCAPQQLLHKSTIEDFIGNENSPHENFTQTNNLSVSWRHVFAGEEW